ncbi:uncharacterized protein SPAPADRAFT_63810 [Spathaspora passalidarum NRRL Y-27907]|uniref:RRM domain-containing protein n=1 Tax=Spathaspora passalidarum (strain NRRL Y-27907 / 11-Y1) TaxID=619300 RepID=G3AVN2_SPAPN|nr:uncharacterized protein SPAPADRAFT_63810 [Spathaspora passalidarum NRRL Y-27907]EGW30197.1 hypothetical protein SPAPADRAFT_63810 [Spathaspora passalidarum NRRL Y-27907]
MEGMDIDDYSRDRSRSPVRERSDNNDVESSAASTTSSYSRRDYSYRSDRSGYGNERRGGGRRDHGSYDRHDRGRRDYGRGRSRDYSSRAEYSSGGTSDESYRAKTERNYDNSIFIGNIPFDCSDKDVADIFSKDFTIVRSDIVTNRGRSRGMATIEFNNKEDVRSAIEKFDRSEYRGREIFVRQDYPPPEKKEEFRERRETYDNRRDKSYESRRRDQHQQHQQSSKPGCEIFVGNLPFSINWQALKDLMRKAGDVIRADVRMDNWGKSRGFGTVVFGTEEEANKAVEMFQGYEIEGRKLDTRPGRNQSSASNGSNTSDRSSYRERERASSQPVVKPSEFTDGVTAGGERSDTIYVSNLPFATQNDDLFELFETVGRTTKAEIILDPITGRPSGNAVVQFELAELSDNAIENLNNYLYGGRNIQISYAKRPEQV